MKVAKLVTGIFCLVFSIMVLFQSCAAGLSNSLAESGEISGSAGALVALFMIAGGIVMIVTRKSEKKGGSITGIILFALAAVIGFANAGSFSDLRVWSGFCLVLAVMNLCALVFAKKPQTESTEHAPDGK